MTSPHEPTNEQLYERYPEVQQPGQGIVGKNSDSLDARLDRIENALATGRGRDSSPGAGVARGQALALAIVSLVMAIPLTAIVLDTQRSGSLTALIFLLVAWGGILGVNVAFNLGNRPRGTT